MSPIATRLQLLRANQPTKPTTQQVITWARDAATRRAIVRAAAEIGKLMK